MLSDHEQLELSDRLRNGDRAAWGALYEAYHVAVWRHIARLIGNDASQVADITQEVFIAAARSARNFDASRGTLWSWLTGISQRQVALYYRKSERAQRWRRLAADGVVEITRWLDQTLDPQAPWEHRELTEVIRCVLAELPGDYGPLLAAKYLDGRSVEDLVEEWGGSAEAIKSRLARARREFRAMFERLIGSDRTAYLS